MRSCSASSATGCGGSPERPVVEAQPFECSTLKPANSLFVGNGDDLAVDLNGVVTEGEHTIAAFNAAGFDVDTFGFSEIELLGVLRERVAASEFTWVSANVREPDNHDKVFALEQGARPWIIKDVGGVQVGITGLLGPRFSPDYL